MTKKLKVKNVHRHFLNYPWYFYDALQNPKLSQNFYLAVQAKASLSGGLALVLCAVGHLNQLIMVNEKNKK
jgi:hypothetical protein